MPGPQNHYLTLGLRPGASSSDVRRAYRRLVLRYHPDRNPTMANAAGRFQEITEAYEVLSNPARRDQYDALLKSFLSPPAPAKKVRDWRSPVFDFDVEQNSLQEGDARLGATLSAIFFPWLVSHTSFAPTGFSFWMNLLVSAVLGAAAYGSWRAGQLARPVVESFALFWLRSVDAAELAVGATPFVFSALGPVCLQRLSVFLDFPTVPLTGLFPAVLSAAVSAWFSAGIGRAFSYASSPPRRRLGASVGALVGGLLGSVGALLGTAATSDVLQSAFFSLWSCSAGAAAAGGAIAAGFGIARVKSLE